MILERFPCQHCHVYSEGGDNNFLEGKTTEPRPFTIILHSWVRNKTHFGVVTIEYPGGKWRIQSKLPSSCAYRMNFSVPRKTVPLFRESCQTFVRGSRFVGQKHNKMLTISFSRHWHDDCSFIRMLASRGVSATCGNYENQVTYNDNSA